MPKWWDLVIFFFWQQTAHLTPCACAWGFPESLPNSIPWAVHNIYLVILVNVDCNVQCRYRTYVTSTMPIIEKYQKLGLVKTISATPNPDEVSSYSIGTWPNNLSSVFMDWANVMSFVEKDILVERFLLLSYFQTCRCLKRLKSTFMDSNFIRWNSKQY